ncbi:MAG: HEAT repeat domain-containing protein [Burkholderiales bacterium]|nr:HEAT repeat domain-containing protein [Opitutaceae bacterium]
MKSYVLALLAIVALTSLGIYLVARKPANVRTPPVVVIPAPPAPPPAIPRVPPADPASILVPSPANVAATNPAAPASSHHLVTGIVARKTDQPGAPFPAEDPLAAERESIHALATSNNPANVPAIARYLDHADAGIRQEAVLGLITLGEKAGAPFLIAATVKARTPEEADTLREAADFLNKGVKDTSLPPPVPEVTNDASPEDLLKP